MQNTTLGISYIFIPTLGIESFLRGLHCVSFLLLWSRPKPSFSWRILILGSILEEITLLSWITKVYYTTNPWNISQNSYSSYSLELDVDGLYVCLVHSVDPLVGFWIVLKMKRWAFVGFGCIRKFFGHFCYPFDWFYSVLLEYVLFRLFVSMLKRLSRSSKFFFDSKHLKRISTRKDLF